MLLPLLLGACAETDDGPVRLVIEASESGTSNPVERGLAQLIGVRLRAARGLEVRIDPAGCGSGVATYAVRIAVGATAGARTHAVTITNCRTKRRETEVFIQSARTAVDPTPGIVLWIADRAGVVEIDRPGLSSDSRMPATALVDYLAAVGQLQQRDAPSVAAARELLQRAVASAPAFADAHAELAVAHLLASEYGLLPTADAVSAAMASIAAAEALEPDHGVAQAARGLAQMVEGHYRAAVPLLREAHRRVPGHDSVLLWLGNAHLYAGEPRAARPWLEAALAINPRLVPIEISLGEAACYLADEAACNAFLEAPTVQPMRRFVVLLLRAHRGRRAEALGQLRQDPPRVASSWLAQLESELCVALEAPGCSELPLPRDVPLQGRPPQDFEIDLWRLDLRLRAALGVAESDPAWQAAVVAELDRLEANGVALPVLGAARACLDPRQPASAAIDPEALRLLGCVEPVP
jgi:hypothetical protein